MKTISGRVTSSNPISLSKATSVLSIFVAAETGASQAVAAYLRRTVEAFNELTQLHRELKGSKSGRKHKRAKEGHESPRLPEPAPANEYDIETESAKGSHEKKKKKKKKKEIEERSSLEFEEERKEKKKKRKNAEVEEGGVEYSEEQQSKKKRKKSD